MEKFSSNTMFDYLSESLHGPLSSILSDIDVIKKLGDDLFFCFGESK